MGLSRQEYWSGLPFPFQGIFPTQGWNLHLLHWQAVYHWDLRSWISTQVSWIAGKFFNYFIVNDVKWQNRNVHSRAKNHLKNECTRQSLDLTVAASSIGHHCVFNIEECVLNGKEKVKGSLFVSNIWILSEKILFCVLTTESTRWVPL